MMALLSNFTHLFLESAPWLVLGLLIAGIMKEWIPANFLSRHLGGRSVATVIKAAFVGAPFPLCSCGVIPAALGLRRSGASKGATTAFLIATPETGVDSVSVSYALLGPFMAIIRPIAAIASAITAGILVGSEKEQPVLPNSAPSPSSCCTNKQQETATSCCASKAKPKPVRKSFVQKLQSGVHFAATDLVADIATWLLIGLGFAAIIQTYVSTDYLSQWGGSIWTMLLIVLISIPMYICATASTPIAAGLLISGISPGAVLVFMLAGPATNIATIGVVYKELGKRAALAYLVGVIGVALLFGFLTDWMIAQFDFSITPLSPTDHDLLPTWVTVSSSLLLFTLMIRHYWKKQPFVAFFSKS